MKTQFLLRFLSAPAQVNGAQGGRRKRPEAGFSMAVTMLIILTVLLGSAAIVSRATGGLLGANLQSKNREARDVAESGIVQIISELNKETNRALLVAGTTPSSWVAANSINPCTKWVNNTVAGGLQPTTQPTATAINYGTDSTNATSNSGLGYQLVSGNNTRTFSLVNVTYSDDTRNAWTSTPGTQVSGTTKSLLQITVLGIVRDANGNELSRATVTREFEVVPKCCKFSFGRNVSSGTTFGTDDRTCLRTTGSGLGIIVGFAGGTSSGNGSPNPKKIKFQDEAIPPNTINTALCVAGTFTPQNACNTPPTGLKITALSFLAKTIPLTIPSLPGTLATTLTRSAINAASKTYIGIKSGNVVQCTIVGNNITPGTCTNLTTQCSSFTSASSASFPGKQYFCRVSTITLPNGGGGGNGGNIIVDTSDEISGTKNALNLYFDNSSYSGSYINFNNNTIQHRYCSSPPGPNTACGTLAQAAQANGGDNLNVFASGSGSFNLVGSPASAMNIYAPNATVDIKGTGPNDAKVVGRLWVNNLTMTGNPTITTNNNSPFGNWFTVPSDLQGVNPNVDWIARSVSRSSSF